MRLRTITPCGAVCGTPVRLAVGPICPLDKDPPDYRTKTPRVDYSMLCGWGSKTRLEEKPRNRTCSPTVQLS